MGFMIMEYLEGESLAVSLERGPMPVAEALRCAIEIAGALDAAHRRGVEIVTSGEAMLVPARVPLVSSLANRLLARAPGLRHLSLVQYLVARPDWEHHQPSGPRPEGVITIEPPPRSPSWAWFFVSVNWL